MATYKYQAFDKAEKKVSGIISASDTIEARNILISRELNPCLLYTSDAADE